MGYELICGIPVAVLAAYAIIFGLFMMLESLEDRVAKQIDKNGRFPKLQKFFRATPHDQPQTH